MILRSFAVAATMLAMLGCSESDGGGPVRLAHFDPALVEGLSDAERVALGQRLSATGSWGNQEMAEFNSLVFGPPGSTEAAFCVPAVGGCDEHVRSLTMLRDELTASPGSIERLNGERITTVVRDANRCACGHALEVLGRIQDDHREATAN